MKFDKSQELLGLLKSKLSNQIKEISIDRGDVVVEIDRQGMLDFFKLLKLDTQLAFNFLVDVTAVDWLDAKPMRFEVVYILMSLANLHRIRVKISIPENKAEVDSIVSLWAGANFMEREAFDMYGVKFIGHPDLRRILMYDEFDGHPLRKDYPVQGKQSRLPMMHPEYKNTAADMVRAPLVTINSKKKNQAANH